MSDQEVVLHAEVRKIGSRGKVNKLRRNGKIPAILYGSKEKNIPLVVDGKEFHSAIHTKHGEHAVISLEVNNDSKNNPKNVIVKDIQYHPVKRNVLHVDFLQISLTQKIEVTVEVETVGLPVGVDTKNGVLDHVTREIKIKCLPSEIPDKIKVDVSSLDIGDGLKVSDLKVSDKIEILEDPKRILATVIPPTKIEEKPPEEEVAVEEEEEKAGPEVISKGKKEEEEEKVEPEVISKGKKEEAESKDKPADKEKRKKSE